jgi:host factor-I protein
MAVRQNIQENYLNSIRKGKIQVNVYLVNGIKLQGHIQSFDTYCIHLVNGKDEQLVFKHGIATVVPASVVVLRDNNASTSNEARAFHEEDLL